MPKALLLAMPETAVLRACMPVPGAAVALQPCHTLISGQYLVTRVHQTASMQPNSMVCNRRSPHRSQPSFPAASSEDQPVHAQCLTLDVCISSPESLGTGGTAVPCHPQPSMGETEPSSGGRENGPKDNRKQGGVNTHAARIKSRPH